MTGSTGQPEVKQGPEEAKSNRNMTAGGLSLVSSVSLQVPAFSRSPVFRDKN